MAKTRSAGQEAAVKAKAAESAREASLRLVNDECPTCGAATLSAVDDLQVGRPRVHLLTRDVPTPAAEAWCLERGLRTYQTWGSTSGLRAPKIRHRTPIHHSDCPPGQTRVLVQHWCEAL